MKIVIENIFVDSDLEKAIAKEDCEIIKYLPFSKEQKITTDLNRRDVIFFGSINMASCLIRHKCQWLGLWADFDTFKCSNYFNHIGNYLINEDYIFLTLKELIRQKNRIFDFFKTDVLFVRPDSGKKPFTGNIVSRHTIDRDVSFLSRVDCDKEILIAVSSAKNLRYEYRLFVSSNRIVTNSLYHVNGCLNIDGYAPQRVLDFGHEVIQNYCPQKCFVLDIGICGHGIDEKIGVVELNSYSCSGMYSANRSVIIDGAKYGLTEEIGNYENISNG